MRLLIESARCLLCAAPFFFTFFLSSSLSLDPLSSASLDDSFAFLFYPTAFFTGFSSSDSDDELSEDESTVATNKSAAATPAPASAETKKEK